MDIPSTSFKTQSLGSSQNWKLPSVRNVAKLLCDQLHNAFELHTMTNMTPTEHETCVSRNLFRMVKSMLTNVTFNSFHITVEGDVVMEELDITDGGSADESYEEPTKVLTRELPSVDVMSRAIAAYDAAKQQKLKAAQQITRRARDKKDIRRFRTYIRQGGTQYNKYQQIKRHVWHHFKIMRAKGYPVHDIDLKALAIEKACHLNVPSFKASDSYVKQFKRQHNIVGRKVTKKVTIMNPYPDVSLELVCDNFRQELQKVIEIGQYTLNNVLNTDQSGFTYEIATKRTLAIKGQKDVAVAVQHMNKTTHSYTIQLSINAIGKLIGPLMIVLQEKGGQFGPRVQKTIDNLQYPNIKITCSKAGKCTKKIMGDYWTTLCENIGDSKALLLLDRWSGQTDATLNMEKLGSNIKTEFFPANTTKFLQPLDVRFFLDYKALVKRISNYAHLHREACQSVDITSRTGIITLHHLVYNQFSSVLFDPLRRYAFSKAVSLFDPPAFQSVRQICFDYGNSRCSVCDGYPLLCCSWCRTVLCFEHFLAAKHYHEPPTEAD